MTKAEIWISKTFTTTEELFRAVRKYALYLPMPHKGMEILMLQDGSELSFSAGEVKYSNTAYWSEQ